MTEPTRAAYRVLARKYRPQTFAQLVGQDILVRTLANAIQSGRVAQAFMLTGVRGVGKTTTARILARALNCVGPDGTGGPTIDPCGVCPHCVAVAEDRHVDVMELDAASRTGVNDMREIIDGVRYRPTSARYKIYIIDEVHMLSKSAFNALLKTLEEPPEHVKFVFATTEIRKVPVTVLSRCQRFDLKRVEPAQLTAHFTRIADDEGATLDAEAAALIARAADGSVRDGLSILDQAIAMAEGAVTATQVREMLGLADHARIGDLLAAIFSGQPQAALEIVEDAHRRGADPHALIQDLLELCHSLTRLKVTPDAMAGMVESERVRLAALAAELSVPSLTRAWQILLKGAQELQAAANPFAALDMVIIRLAFVAELPSPGEMIRRLMEDPPPGGGGGSGPGGGGGPGPVGGGGGGGGGAARGLALAAVSSPHSAPVAQQRVSPAVAGLPQPADFDAVATLFGDKREASLRAHLINHVHLVAFEPGRIELRPTPAAPPDLAGKVGALLSDWTGRRWVVSVASQGGAPTLAQQWSAREGEKRAAIDAHPLVRKLLDAFPGSSVVSVKATPKIAARFDDEDGAADAATEAEPEWEAPLFDPDALYDED